MIAELVACLIAGSAAAGATGPGIPADCTVERLPIADAVTPLGCMLMAPAAIARWAEDHPARRVVRWTCRPATERRA